MMANRSAVVPVPRGCGREGGREGGREDDETRMDHGRSQDICSTLHTYITHKGIPAKSESGPPARTEAKQRARAGRKQAAQLCCKNAFREPYQDIDGIIRHPDPPAELTICVPAARSWPNRPLPEFAPIQFLGQFEHYIE